MVNAVFGIILTIGTLIYLAAKILIMLAVGQDAKALGVKDRTLWMILTFFIPYAAIIYVCMRKDIQKEIPKYCPQCKQYVPADSYICPHCGNAALTPCEHRDAQKLKKSARSFTIAGAIAYGLSCIVLYIGALGLMAGLMNGVNNFVNDFDNFGEYFGDGGYYEYDEDDPFEFYDDYFDDYEDYFDDFD